MTGNANTQARATSWPVVEVPENVRVVFRSLGQVFFQENALTGVLFAIGIAMSSPLMALGRNRWLGDRQRHGPNIELRRSGPESRNIGINAAVIGIATLFFFPLGG